MTTREKLVAEMGIYILETALAEAVTGNDDPHTVEIDGKRITQHEHHAAMCAEEEALIERITADIATRKALCELRTEHIKQDLNQCQKDETDRI